MRLADNRRKWNSTPRVGFRMHFEEILSMSSTLRLERCPRLALSLIGALAALVVSGCGGGGSDDAGGPPPSSAGAAAKATANSVSNDCNDARPFYWEVGNADGTTA